MFDKAKELVKKNKYFIVRTGILAATGVACYKLGSKVTLNRENKEVKMIMDTLIDADPKYVYEFGKFIEEVYE